MEKQSSRLLVSAVANLAWWDGLSGVRACLRASVGSTDAREVSPRLEAFLDACYPRLVSGYAQGACAGSSAGMRERWIAIPSPIALFTTRQPLRARYTQLFTIQL